MNRICKDCGDTLQSYEQTKEKHYFSVFGFCIVRYYNEEVFYCYACESDKKNRYLDDAYNAGAEHGYQKGLNDRRI